jgi:hypothetical protein
MENRETTVRSKKDGLFSMIIEAPQNLRMPQASIPPSEIEYTPAGKYQCETAPEEGCLVKVDPKEEFLS